MPSTYVYETVQIFGVIWEKKKKQNNWINLYTKSTIDVFINALVATDMLVRSYV